MKQQKIYYYSDEVNDDFAGTHIVRKPLPENYEYLNKGFWLRLRRGIFYHCIIRPITFIYNKLIKRVKYVGKQKLKGYKKGGAFMYGNHTSMIIDAFNPSYLAFPRPADVIINADAMSITGIGWLLKTIGGFPIPEGFHAMARFNAAVNEAYSKRHWIAVYPEAHIWHYYTGIRPFPSVSFAYPVKNGAPSFAYTMTYKKRKHSRYPKRVVYIDGPFFPDKSIPPKQAERKLRDEIYSAMCERAKESDCEYIKYVYRPKEEPKAVEPSDGATVNGANVNGEPATYKKAVEPQACDPENLSKE